MNAKPAWPDDDAMRKDIAARMAEIQRAYEARQAIVTDATLIRSLMEQEKAIKKRLQAIKKQLNSRPKPDRARELRDRRNKLGAELRAVQLKGNVLRSAISVERNRHLLGALMLCNTLTPLPEWLYEALRDQLKASVPQELGELGLRWVRWEAVREAKQAIRIVRGRKRKTTWLGENGAYEQASKRLAGTPWAGKWRVMKESYLLCQSELRAIRDLESGPPTPPA